jgi:branched-chain amino acid transport system permease protein
MQTVKQTKRASGMADKKLWWAVLAGIVLIALPAFLSQSWVSITTEMLIMSLAACALNIMLGYTGMVSFGPAGLYAVGAYATAVLLERLGVSLPLALLAAPVLSALIGVAVGWICVRRSAVYFALLTLAFAQIIWTVIFEWYSVTGGDDGLVDIPIPEFFFSISNSYYFNLGIVSVCIFVIWRVVNSPFGRTLQAIRENPDRVEFIGVNVKKYQLAAFVLSSVFLGISGSLYCVFSGSVFPNYAHWVKSTDMLVICLMGGLYNFFGPVVGTAIYTVLSKVIAKYTMHWHLILGAIIVMIVLMMRNGVVGSIANRIARARRAGSASEV